MSVWYIGSALAFQANEAGPIPAILSRIARQEIPVMHSNEATSNVSIMAGTVKLPCFIKRGMCRISVRFYAQG